jgi:hypothetical protein
MIEKKNRMANEEILKLLNEENKKLKNKGISWILAIRGAWLHLTINYMKMGGMNQMSMAHPSPIDGSTSTVNHQMNFRPAVEPKF